MSKWWPSCRALVVLLGGANNCTWAHSRVDYVTLHFKYINWYWQVPSNYIALKLTVNALLYEKYFCYSKTCINLLLRCIYTITASDMLDVQLNAVNYISVFDIYTGNLWRGYIIHLTQGQTQLSCLTKFVIMHMINGLKIEISFIFRNISRCMIIIVLNYCSKSLYPRLRRKTNCTFLRTSGITSHTTKTTASCLEE